MVAIKKPRKNYIFLLARFQIMANGVPRVRGRAVWVETLGRHRITSLHIRRCAFEIERGSIASTSQAEPGQYVSENAPINRKM